MPPLDQLPPPTTTRARTVALFALRTYLVVAGAIVAAKVALASVAA